MSKLALLGGPKVRRKPFASHPRLGKEERREVLSVLRSGVLSGFVAAAGDGFLGGPKVRKLERLFCDYFGTPYAVAMNSATSALHAALLAVGIGPGDEVIVPPYTMSATASAVLMCGALPVFVDIEEGAFCLDPEKIEARLTRRTKAILVVHLFGRPARMRQILALAKKHGLQVIEDCAQAPGAKYQGRFAGTLGDVGVFSFNQHKTITTGEGGVAITANKDLALRLQLVRNHGEAVVAKMKEAAAIPCLGWNYRMTELEAAVGAVQFQKLDFLNDHRIRLAEYLTRRLTGMPGLELPGVGKNEEHVYFVYPIRYDAQKAGISRHIFVKALVAEGIPFSEGYVRPLYLEPLYRTKKIFQYSRFPFDSIGQTAAASYQKGSCPVAEQLYDEGLMLTGLCRYPLSFRDMDDVVAAFQKIYANRVALMDNGAGRVSKEMVAYGRHR